MARYETPFERLVGQTVTDVDTKGGRVVIKLEDDKGKETRVTIEGASLAPSVTIDREGP